MATHLWALAEGLTVLKGQGVDLSSALNCINHSSGKSSMSENIMAQRVLSREFHKDLCAGFIAERYWYCFGTGATAATGFISDVFGSATVSADCQTSGQSAGFFRCGARTWNNVHKLN